MTSERNIINHPFNSDDHGIINVVRNIEKLEYRLVKHRSTRTFNLRCLQEKFIPTGCRVKFKCKNNFERKIIKKAELQLFNNGIRDYH